MGRRKAIPELKEILHRLKLGQAKRTIQKPAHIERSSGERRAAMHGWFQSDILPEEEEIMRVRDGQIKIWEASAHHNRQPWLRRVAVFTNPLIASAAIDRLVHRGMKIVVEGKSCRLESFNRKMKRPSKRQ